MNPNRRFVYEILGLGLELETVTPEDVLAQVTPEVLAHHLPVDIKAKLLSATLEADRVTPGLIIEVVGIEALVEHSPIPVLWRCIRAAAVRAIQSSGSSLGAAASDGPSPASPRAETVDEDSVASAGPLKPAKSARPSRAPARVSSLSPRSRVVRGREEATSDSLLPPEPGPQEFDVSEETDIVRAGGVRSTLQANDEETRPGPKS